MPDINSNSGDKEKPIQMNLNKHNHSYFELPKATVIAFMGAIMMAVFGGVIGYFVKITQLENDVDVINMRLEWMETSTKDYTARLTAIQRQLDRIEHSLNMKQDRKFVE